MGVQRQLVAVKHGHYAWCASDRCCLLALSCVAGHGTAAQRGACVHKQKWCFHAFQAASILHHVIGSCKYAGQGTDEHERRQRLLALTGWSAEVLKPDQVASAASSGIKATAAALRCTMCNARVGLWNFVPEMALASPAKAAAGAPGSSIYIRTSGGKCYSVFKLCSMEHGKTDTHAPLYETGTCDQCLGRGAPPPHAAPVALGAP